MKKIPYLLIFIILFVAIGYIVFTFPRTLNATAGITHNNMVEIKLQNTVHKAPDVILNEHDKKYITNILNTIKYKRHFILDKPLGSMYQLVLTDSEQRQSLITIVSEEFIIINEKWYRPDKNMHEMIKNYLKDKEYIKKLDNYHLQ